MRQILKAGTPIVLIVAALSSIGFMFYTARSQRSIILLLLFTIWVGSPFIALFYAQSRSKQKTDKFQNNFRWLTLFICIVSVLIYSGILGRLSKQPAFIYLVVPFISWFLIISMIIGSKFLSKKNE